MFYGDCDKERVKSIEGRFGDGWVWNGEGDGIVIGDDCDGSEGRNGRDWGIEVWWREL